MLLYIFLDAFSFSGYFDELKVKKKTAFIWNSNLCIIVNVFKVTLDQFNIHAESINWITVAIELQKYKLHKNIIKVVHMTCVLYS